MKGRRWGFVSCVSVACVCLEIAACIVWIVQAFAAQYSSVQEECCEVVAATCLNHHENMSGRGRLHSCVYTAP